MNVIAIESKCWDQMFSFCSKANAQIHNHIIKIFQGTCLTSFDQNGSTCKLMEM